MVLKARLWRNFPRLIMLAAVVLSAGYGSGSASESSGDSLETGKVLSVRKVLRDQYFVSRYPRIHYYLLYLSVHAGNQTYCSEYETPVLEEITDVSSAKDKNVEFVLKGKSLTLITPGGRRIKAHLVEDKQC